MRDDTFSQCTQDFVHRHISSLYSLMPMHHLLTNEWLDFETIRILGTAPYRGVDVAEVLEAVGEIKNGDPQRWQTAWASQARPAKALAHQACQSGDVKSARQAFLRASNYTRATGYLLLGNGPNDPNPALVHRRPPSCSKRPSSCSTLLCISST